MSESRSLRTVPTRLSYLAFGAGLVVLCLFPFVLPDFTAYLIALLLYITLAVAWNLQGGYLGDLSFGHVVFFGISGYSAALMVDRHVLNWAPLNILLGALLATFFAAVIGALFLRLRGFYFAIGTLGLSSLMLLTVKNILAPLTRGASGLTIPPPQPYRVEVFFFAILGIALLSLGASVVVVRSRVGLAFQAIRDNAEAARALGVNTTFYRVLGFAASAFLVGIAGGFYAYYSSYINPEGMFGATISFEMLVMVFFGGAGTLAGPVVGAVIFYILEELGRAYIGQGFYILPALMLVLVFRFMPTGIMGLVRGSLALPRGSADGPRHQSGS